MASAAIAAGVRRFVFVSSIGVLGNETAGEAFCEKTVPRPVEPYAVSKYEAEQELTRLGQQGGLEVVIVRPPGVPWRFVCHLPRAAVVFCC